jgi:hypothetical protein
LFLLIFTSSIGIYSQPAKAALIWDLAKEGNTAALAQELLGSSEADLSFEQLRGVKGLAGWSQQSSFIHFYVCV